MRQRMVTLITAVAIATVAVLGVGFGNVEAHNGGVTAGCNNGVPTVSANLTNYNGTNLISIKNNGVEIGPGTFGSSYVATLSLGSPFISHTVVWKVTAHEDPNNVNGFSPGGTIEVPACQTPPSTTVGPTPPPRPSPLQRHRQLPGRRQLQRRRQRFRSHPMLRRQRVRSRLMLRSCRRQPPRMRLR